MSLYREVVTKLRTEDFTTELFRFQGANSIGYYDIETHTFTETPKDNYVYISASPEHHKYFAVRRIKQLINDEILDDTPYFISKKDLRDRKAYSTIKRLVLNSDKLKDIYSVRFITDRSIIGLFKENSFGQSKKIEGKPIERVDKKTYSGGYGISEDWKDLLLCLTYFDGYQRIDRKSIVQLIATMKASGKIDSKENITAILTNPGAVAYSLSPKVEANFTKYDIMNGLERILEKGTYSPTSELGKHPKETIKKVVESYETGKEKVLIMLENQYKKKNNSKK